MQRGCDEIFARIRGHHELARLAAAHRSRERLDGHDLEPTALKDPPMLILPNTKLMGMENAVKIASRDLRFRVWGMVTEYNGRNYILVEQFVVKPDETVPPSKKADDRANNNPIRP